MSDFIDLKSKLFKDHPTVKLFFITSDGQAFTLLCNGEAHAHRLKDKIISEVFNPDMTDEEIEALKLNMMQEEKEGLIASFKMANKELSKCITINASNPNNIELKRG